MNGKLQVLYSRKQGFTVPAEPSPTKAACQQPTANSQALVEDKTPVLLLLPKWGCKP